MQHIICEIEFRRTVAVLSSLGHHESLVPETDFVPEIENRPSAGGSCRGIQRPVCIAVLPRHCATSWPHHAATGRGRIRGPLFKSRPVTATAPDSAFGVFHCSHEQSRSRRRRAWNAFPSWSMTSRSTISARRCCALQDCQTTRHEFLSSRADDLLSSCAVLYQSRKRTNRAALASHGKQRVRLGQGCRGGFGSCEVRDLLLLNLR